VACSLKVGRMCVWTGSSPVLNRINDALGTNEVMIDCHNAALNMLHTKQFSPMMPM